jgi:hypothetical protein
MQQFENAVERMEGASSLDSDIERTALLENCWIVFSRHNENRVLRNIESFSGELGIAISGTR